MYYVNGWQRDAVMPLGKCIVIKRMGLINPIVGTLRGRIPCAGNACAAFHIWERFKTALIVYMFQYVINKA